jgi:hypothetical protein
MKLSEVFWQRDDLDEKIIADPLQEIKVVRIAVLHRGRNAWHTTWVEHYLKDAELFTDVVAAKKGAEVQRRPGNKFYITEVPALMLRSDNFCAVVVDANERSPFKNFIGLELKAFRSEFGNYLEGIYPGIDIYEALEIIGNETQGWNDKIENSHLVLSGEIPKGVSLNLDLENLKKLISISTGSEYLLSWSEALNSQNSEFALLIEKKWEKLKRHNFEEAHAYQSKRAWARKVDTELANLRKVRDLTDHRFSTESNHLDLLEDLLADAKEELELAMNDRMRPASTSKAIAKQRVRVETAQKTFEELEVKNLAQSLEVEKIQRELNLANGELFRARLSVRESFKIG